MVTHTISLDLQQPGARRIIYAKQADELSRQVEISLYSGGATWAVPDNAVISLRYLKEDKHGGEYDTMPDGSSAWTLSADRNVVTVILHPQVLTCAGVVRCDLNVATANDSISTFTWYIDVEERSDLIALDSDDYFNLSSACAFGIRNGLTGVAEFLGIARSYYMARGTAEEPTFFYQTFGTPLDDDFDDSQKYIDCSSFVGLMLRGIPYGKSAYADSSVYPERDSDEEGEDEESDDDSGGDGDAVGGYAAAHTAANTADYAWAVNPSEFLEVRNTGEAPRPIRSASQLAQWLVRQGRAVRFQPDFSNVEPGDIIFWAKRLEDGAYKQPNRYLCISHVAVCYSKLPQPEDVTLGMKNGVEITGFNAATALAWLEAAPRSVTENTIYQMTYLSGKWFIRKRSAEKNQQTEDWDWSYLNSSGAWVSNSSAEKQIQLTTLGITATVQTGAADVSFRLTQYYWERDKYPYKHTMMEVTSATPYVLNRTLEKIRPGEVALICRPDLGGNSSDNWAGSVVKDLGMTGIQGLFRQGLYYLTSDVTGGLPPGFTTGIYTALRVEAAMTKHGWIQSVTHTIWLERGTKRGFWRNVQYCYSHEPRADAWEGWVYFPTETEIRAMIAEALGQTT